jgi:hypothetical protein
MRYSCQTTMFGTGNEHCVYTGDKHCVYWHCVFRYRAPDVQAEDHLGRLPPSRLTLAGMFPGQSW